MSKSPGEIEAGFLCSHIFKTDEISSNSVSGSLEVSAQDCTAIAKVLDLLSLNSMRMDFNLQRSGRGRFKLNAHLLADVTQSCVLTLEPIESKVDEEFSIEFWPPEDVEQLESEAEEAGMDVPLDGPEPILEERIDVGQMAYEHFAAALDPYPRKPDSSFDWKDPQAGPDSEDINKPFAELARLKDANGASSD
ncbi:MAG: DUF177 domain-containing protein [Gammaproteobacteria bacterium]